MKSAAEVYAQVPAYHYLAIALLAVCSACLLAVKRPFHFSASNPGGISPFGMNGRTVYFHLTWK
jgi:hypothetical protein